jgi:hypothetical protein
MHSDVEEPLNIGSGELVTINQLVDIVEGIAGIKLKRSYKIDAPRGRFDNRISSIHSAQQLASLGRPWRYANTRRCEIGYRLFRPGERYRIGLTEIRVFSIRS